MHRVRFSSAIALAITATSALAQTPAAPQPDGHRLRLATDSLEVYVVRLGHPQRTGFLIDRLDTSALTARRCCVESAGHRTPHWVAARTPSCTRSRRCNLERPDALRPRRRTSGLAEESRRRRRRRPRQSRAIHRLTAAEGVVQQRELRPDSARLSARRGIRGRGSHVRTRGLARTDRDGRRFGSRSRVTAIRGASKPTSPDFR